MILQDCQLMVHEIQLLRGQGRINVPKLVWIHSQVVVRDQTGDEFAIQIVVSPVHISHTRVRVCIAMKFERKCAN